LKIKEFPQNSLYSAGLLRDQNLEKAKDMKTEKDINFTKATLMGLPIPANGRPEFFDAKERGLSLYMTPTGNTSFMIRKRINGKDKEIVIGHFPDMTVELARKEAQRIKLQIELGGNPLEEKEKQTSEKTFGEAYQMYMDKYAKAEKRSWIRNKHVINRFLSSWIDRKFSSITRHEMQEIHSRIGQEKGKYMANRLLAYISAIYNKMISWGWEGRNPAIGIAKFKEQKRDRFILKDEFPRFMEALEMGPNRDMRDFFLACLYTGARKTNVLEMRWSDIDFSINEWHIRDTKNGDPVRVPLIGQALEILKGRLPLKESSPWVFPSKESKSGYLQEPKTAWKRILEGAGLENLRIHGLRRTYGSYQATAGTSLTIIGKSLGHKSPQSTAIYARLSNDPVRVSMEAAFDFASKK
jgi:integrase